jgi:hypothetical protein
MRVLSAAVCALAIGVVLAGPGASKTMTHQAQGSLAARALYVANHGGIRSHRYGDATQQMKSLVRQLIRQTFRPAGAAAVTHALCYSRRESGWNPGAISPTHDHSSFQVNEPSNEPSHPQFDYARMDRDPAYGVWAGWVVSSHGRDWGPWSGGVYAC